METYCSKWVEWNNKYIMLVRCDIICQITVFEDIKWINHTYYVMLHTLRKFEIAEFNILMTIVCANTR